MELRTAQSLRLLVQMLRRLSDLVRMAAGTTSPVAKGMRRLQGRSRRLQVSETVQLGEKRFVAILRVDGEQFLIGGSTTGISLLASLAHAPATSVAEPVQVVSPMDGPTTEVTAAPNDWTTPQEPASFSAVLAAQSRAGGLA